MEIIHNHPEFVTATIVHWQKLLHEDANKELIMQSLSFLVREERIILYAFVIMNNHIHLIWQVKGLGQCANVRRDFFRFTAQHFKRKMEAEELCNYRSTQADRKFQVWKRNTLCVELYSDKFFQQKLQYIHRNPVKAGLCTYEEEYLYSSARFYRRGEDRWGILTHCG